MTLFWSGDGIELHLGDCLQVDAWLTADVLVTDPPYGIGWKRSENPARQSRAHPGIAGDASTEVRDAALQLWGTERPAIVFGSLDAPRPAGVRHTLIWQKAGDAGVVGSTTGFRRDIEAVFLTGGPLPRRPPQWSSVIRSGARNSGSPNSPAGRTGHPHSKPVDIMQRLIDLAPGTIADPFAGSASTLWAAKLSGRKAIGVEVDEAYCEAAARRLDQGALVFDVDGLIAFDM